jgi:hypothetical protein
LKSQILALSFIGVYIPVFELTCIRFVDDTATFDDTVCPSTFTIPLAISYSAYLLEHTPILANLLLNLSVALNVSAFSTLM